MLLWMIFTGLSIFAAVLLWRYGFIRLMVASDRTYISSLIAVLYIVTCFHCFWRTRAIAREAEVAQALPRGAVGRGGSESSRCRCTRAAGRTGDGPHPQPRDQGRDARGGAHRPDAAAALARRPAARLQRLWLLRLRYADEARPARHHHRLHHHAGADREPRCRRQGRDEILDGA